MRQDHYAAGQKFKSLERLVAGIPIPQTFTFPYQYTPHPLSLIACKMLQAHLMYQEEWNHNFGLDNDGILPVIGKMFGVLVVMTSEGELGYLAAFSGKLAGSNHHSFFVPPVYDGLAYNGFLNSGMREIAEYGRRIAKLTENSGALKEVNEVKALRRNRSVALQNELFDQYHFLNQFGSEKSLRSIFQKTGHSNPPAGAGECAAPKLLQYAFQHQLQPISMAEFWWGASPKSTYWKHGQFYPSCQEKCAPILSHMLEGMELE